MTELRLGFAGVGKMGGLMVARLIKAGHPLTVFDANDLAVEPLVKAGARRAKALRELAGQAEIVFASLPTPDVVREVALGAGGIVESATTKLFVDLSTTGPRVARIVAEGLAAKGITAVDCPVSGGLSGARNGTLALMVSCPTAACDGLQELLAVFGKPIFVSEIPGAAQTMKLANNLLAACAIAISWMYSASKAGWIQRQCAKCSTRAAAEIPQHWTSFHARCCRVRSISVFRRPWLSRM